MSAKMGQNLSILWINLGSFTLEFNFVDILI